MMAVLKELLQWITFLMLVGCLLHQFIIWDIKVEVGDDYSLFFLAEFYLLSYIALYVVCGCSVTINSVLSWFYKLLASCFALSPSSYLDWLGAETSVPPRIKDAIFLAVFIILCFMTAQVKKKFVMLCSLPVMLLLGIFLVILTLSSLIKVLGWGFLLVLIVGGLSGGEKKSVPNVVIHHEAPGIDPDTGMYTDGRQAYYLQQTYTKDGEKYVTMQHEGHEVDLRVGNNGRLYDKKGKLFDNYRR